MENAKHAEIIKSLICRVMQLKIPRSLVAVRVQFSPRAPIKLGDWPSSADPFFLSKSWIVPEIVPIWV